MNALRKDTELYRKMVEEMTDGIAIQDHSGRITYVNSAFCAMTGYAKAETIGKKTTDFLDKRNIEILEHEIAKRREGNMARSYEIEIKSKEGIPVTVVASPRDITNAEGEAIGSFAVFTDITVRKKIEKKIQDSERLYRNLFETVPDAIILLDAETKTILDANDAALSLYGYSKQELLGLNVTEMSAEPEETVRTIDKMASGEVSHVPLRLHKKRDGTVFPVEVSSGAFTLDNHTVGFGVVKDITNRKKREEMIESSLREKEVLLREVHHRVKNNLQVVSSLLSLGKYKRMGHSPIDLLAEAQSRIRAIALIHSQLYAGEKLDSIVISKHISQLWDHLRTTYLGSNTQVTFDLKPSNICLPLEQCIPFCLALNEILTNACKHAFKNQKQGAITVLFEQEENDIVRVSISDNGSGLPDSVLENPCDTVGLNLATTLIRDQLHGKILFEVKNGTTVSIRFRVEE